MDNSENRNKVPTLDSNGMSKWKFLLKVHLDSKECGLTMDTKRPIKDRSKFLSLKNAQGKHTKKSVEYAQKVKKRAKAWDAIDRKSYAYVVKACEPNATAMEVVLAEENKSVTTKALVTKLIDRFSKANMVGVVQSKLAAFNTLEIQAPEKTEPFMNRVLESRRELLGLGQDYVDLDVFCLGRLKETLMKDKRYVQLAMTLRSNAAVKWTEAVDICSAFDETMAPGEETKATAGPPGNNVEESMRKLIEKKFSDIKRNWKGKKNANIRPKKKDFKCHTCGKVGHYARECRQNKNADEKCEHCGKSGHSKDKCFKRKREQGGDDGYPKRKHHFDDEFDFMLRTDEHKRSDRTGSKYLLLDSGATSHIVTEAFAKRVKNADLQKSSVRINTAKSGESFKAKSRGKLGKLKEVLVTDDSVLTEGVASVPRLDRDGKYTLCGGGKSCIYDANPLLDPTLQPVAVAPLGDDNAYKFLGSDLTGEETVRLASAAPPETPELWHKRLGHRNIANVCQAIRDKKITGPAKEVAVNKVTKRGLCETCIKAKSTRRSFATAKPNKVKDGQNGLVPVDKVIALVSTDLKGPMSVAGPKGEKYFQLYTDNSTKWRTCKLLQAKSDAVSCTKEFFVQDIRAEGQTLTRYHADGAPELISAETVTFMAEHECRVTYSPPYTPERNGVSERSNRTIWESGYAMWLATALPAMFWTHAVSYATICANYLPTSTSKGNITPFEAKYGVVPDVSRFRIFGCIAYIHVPSELRDSTMADKAYKGYFIGMRWPFLDRYQVFVPSLDKILESAHVLFDEVTKVRRDTEVLLVVDPQRKSVQDFSFLANLAYVDPESDVVYVTTRVTTSRGFIVAYRAPVVQGKLGKEEAIPIHAKDVEGMVVAHWEKRYPVMWMNNVLTKLCDVIPQGAPLHGRKQPDQLLVPVVPDYSTGPPQGGRSPEQSAGRKSFTAAPVVEAESPSEGASPQVDPAGRPRRTRTPRQLLNVADLGDVTEQARYLATEAVDEADDTDPRWDSAKMKELESHELEHWSYEVVPLPLGRKAINSKWVMKVKPDRLKGRFTPKGCGQKANVDYKETYAPVAKLVTLRIFLTVVAILQLATGQLDLKTAFLNAELEEEIYCQPLHDHIYILTLILPTLSDALQVRHITDSIRALKRGGVLRLKKAIYGLKQAPRAWWLMLHAFLRGLGFVSNACDVCLYVLHLPGNMFVLLLLYVDDILLAASTPSLVDKYVRLIARKFKVSSEGPLSTYLGFEIIQDLAQHRVELNMNAYVEKMFKRFGVVPKQSVVTPMQEGIMNALAEAPEADQQFVEDFEYREKIGCVLYLMICMRPDIMFAVGLLARFCNKVNKVAAAGVTQLLQFIWNTRRKTLALGGKSAYVTAFSDSDHAGCLMTRKSTGCFILYFGLGPVEWRSKLQTIVALSSGEAEYIGLDGPARAILSLRSLLKETRIGVLITSFSSTLFTDSTVAESIATNRAISDRTKHIALRFHFLRQLYLDGVIMLEHVDTALNVADIGTKSLPKRKFPDLADIALGHKEFVKPQKRAKTESESSYA